MLLLLVVLVRLLIMRMDAVLMAMVAGQPNVLAVAHLAHHLQGNSSSRVSQACQQHHLQRGQVVWSLLVAGRLSWVQLLWLSFIGEWDNSSCSSSSSNQQAKIQQQQQQLFRKRRAPVALLLLVAGK
jgi:hypothetical protein